MSSTVSELDLASRPGQSLGIAPMNKIHWVYVCTPLAVMAVFAGIFWGFVSHSFVSNPALNGLILLVMGWGAFLMLALMRRTYSEFYAFRTGMAWFHEGLDVRNNRHRGGPNVYIVGMLERLGKLGLGHELHVHSSAMEPEIEALEQYLTKKQELAQYVVGLMVGLGLLGTFIGLLETLVATSTLIGTIAAGATGSGDSNMDAEFAKIVGGLQAPLSAMGTAFSASMFGLVGSIMLGFQMVIVRKTTQTMVEKVRRAVLSLAEKSNTDSEVKISERYLSTLLADILLAHRQTTQGFSFLTNRLEQLVDEVHTNNARTHALTQRFDLQDEALVASVQSFSGLSQDLAKVAQFNEAFSGLMASTLALQQRTTEHMEQLPQQIAALQQRMEFMGGQLSGIAQANLALAQRMDAHEQSLRQTCEALGTVTHLVQSLDTVCDNTDALTQQVQDSNAISERIAQQMPSQVSFQKELNRSLARIDSLKTVVQSLQTSIAGVRQDLRKNV